MSHQLFYAISGIRLYHWQWSNQCHISTIRLYKWPWFFLSHISPISLYKWLCYISESDPSNVTSTLLGYISDSSNVTSAILFHVNYRPGSFLNPLATLPYFDASHQFLYLCSINMEIEHNVVWCFKSPGVLKPYSRLMGVFQHLFYPMTCVL